MFDRHHLRAAHRHPMGDAPQRNGLRLRHDLLATVARLARRRRLADDPRVLAGPPQRGRHDRLVARGDRLQFSSRCRGGEHTGPNPTDRRKPGSKHHIVTEARGIPLVAKLTAANVNDGTQLLDLIDAIPAVRGKVGAPRFRPDAALADKAYHSNFRAVMLQVKGIQPMLPRRGTDDDEGLGQLRWVVERTIAWLHQFRRLRIRYEKRADIHQAFLTIGCVLICFRTLPISFC